MCGIVGTLARRGRIGEQNLRDAVRSLHHRGPDASGAETFELAGEMELRVGHARLSIIDLSDAANQPLRTERGTLCFNGELYNYVELKASLAGRWKWETSGDTEVFLAGLLEEGPSFLPSANGMFALGLYNAQRNTLLLARDRMGKKPLFVYQHDGILAFASELKAFHAMGLPLTVDPQALAYYRWLNYVPATLSIYREVRKLAAASYVEFDLRAPIPETWRGRTYWDPLAACARTFSGTFEEGVEELEHLVEDATRIRLRADVATGVFLSAGVDSGIVAAAASRANTPHPRAFVVRAADPDLDESSAALATASVLGLDASVLDLPLASYPTRIEAAADAYDEPCAPLSGLATMMMAEVAAREVKVVLTGDGGDEIFLGYPWVCHPETLWGHRARFTPWKWSRRAASRALESSAGDALLRRVVQAMGYNVQTLEVKKYMARDLLRAEGPAQLYEHFQVARPHGSLSPEDRALLGPASLLDRARSWYPEYSWAAAKSRSVPELVSALDFVVDMRDHILTKLDRATMAYSLEARSPLLDYRIVEHGFSLPRSHKIGPAGAHKRALRALARKMLGPRVSERRKSGFGVPFPPGMPDDISPAASYNRLFEERWTERWSTSSTSHLASGKQVSP